MQAIFVDKDSWMVSLIRFFHGPYEVANMVERGTDRCSFLGYVLESLFAVAMIQVAFTGAVWLCVQTVLDLYYSILYQQNLFEMGIVIPIIAFGVWFIYLAHKIEEIKRERRYQSRLSGEEEKQSFMSLWWGKFKEKTCVPLVIR